MANKIATNRFGQAPGEAPFMEVLVFKEYQEGADIPEIAHALPGQESLWVFESYSNPMFDMMPVILAHTATGPDGKPYLDIPYSDGYWRPLGTNDGSFLPLPFRAGVAQITREQYESYVAANPENPAPAAPPAPAPRMADPAIAMMNAAIAAQAYAEARQSGMTPLVAALLVQSKYPEFVPPVEAPPAPPAPKEVAAKPATKKRAKK